MKHGSATVLLAAALLAGGAAPARADVQLTIQNGRVSLTATGATVREILAEWARVGQTRIINGEKVPGGPISLQLTNEPEDSALDTILRSASGYMAAPRASFSSNASKYDRIVVMPTSSAPRNVAPPPPTYQPPQPTFNPQFPQPVDDDQDGPAPGPAGVMPNPRGPIFNTFPQPGGPGGQQPPTPQPAPSFGSPTPGGAPVGVAVPGMVVQPPPPQPGQAPPP
jgi:hypothetical protein